METDTIAKKRDDTFDVMKCIGIIAVIVGHLSASGVQFIFSWHMPLFFIVAGYFYREKGTREMMQRDAKHLLLPYFVTCLAVIIYYAIASCIDGHDIVSKWIVASVYANGSLNHTSRYFAKVPIIGAIWFLWALFWCKCTLNLIYKHFHNVYLLICLAVSLLAIYVDRHFINLPFAFLPGLSATIFFAVGCWIKQRGGFKEISIILALICFIIWVISFTHFKMSMVRCFYTNYPVNVIGACGATYFIWSVSNLLSRGKGRIISFLAWIGRNSLTILCIHLFDLDVPVRATLYISGPFKIPYVILICIIGTYLLSKINLMRKVFNII